MGWLDNVSGVPQAHFSLLLIGQQGFNIFSGTGPCFPLAGRFWRRYPEKMLKLQLHNWEVDMKLHYKEVGTELYN